MEAQPVYSSLWQPVASNSGKAVTNGQAPNQTPRRNAHLLAKGPRAASIPLQEA